MLASDNKEAARREFERALSLAPNDLNCREQYARFLLSNQDVASAETQARKAVTLKPGSLAANSLLGQCLTIANKPAEALVYLNAAIKLDCNDPTVSQNLMTAYNRLGNFTQARKWQARYTQNARYAQKKRDLESVVRLHPEDRQAQRHLAAFFAADGDVNGCLLHHAAAEKAQPNSPRALLAAAHDLDKAGYSQQALALVRRITQETHSSVEATELLADILLHLGRIHEAAINYDMLREAKADQKAHYRQNIAAAVAKMANSNSPSERVLQQIQTDSDPRQSEQRLQKILEQEPENTRLLRPLLRLQFGLGEKEAAADTARKLSAISPEDGLSQTLLSVLMLEGAPPGPLNADLIQEIESRLRNAENDPSILPTLFYAHGLLFLREGKAQEAIHDLAQSLRLAPESPAAYRRLAEAKQMAGDLTGAKQALAAFEKHAQFPKVVRRSK